VVANQLIAKTKFNAKTDIYENMVGLHLKKENAKNDSNSNNNQFVVPSRDLF